MGIESDRTMIIVVSFILRLFLGVLMESSWQKLDL